MGTKIQYLQGGIKFVAIAVFALSIWGCPKGGGEEETPLPPTPPAILQSIRIVPSANATSTIPLTATKQFLAMGTYSSGPNRPVSSVIWASFATTTATVNGSGSVTGVNLGTVNITARSGTIEGSLSVQVVPPVSIAVTATSSVMDKGTTQPFIATATFGDGSTGNFTALASWSPSPLGVATVNNAGVVLGVSVGTATITASFGSVSGSAPVQVSNVRSITISPPSANILTNTSQQFTAVAHFVDGQPDENITTTGIWMTSSSSVTINPSGVAVATSEGSANITVTFQGKTQTAFINVAEALLQSISITPSNSFLLPGFTRQFTAMGKYNNGSEQDITTRATWSSTDTLVATVGTTTGVVTAVPVSSPSTTTINAQFLGQNGTTSLTVIPGELIGLDIDLKNTTMAQKTKKQFAAKGTFSTGGVTSNYDMTQLVAWTSDAPLIAEVGTSTGMVTAGSVSATTTVFIHASFGTSTATSTTVTVTPATLTQVSISPISPIVPVGVLKLFMATGTFSDNTKQDIGLSVNWASSDSAIATIDPFSGFATAGSVGTTYIKATATFGDTPRKFGETVLTVDDSTCQELSIEPSSKPVIPIMTTQAFKATCVFSSGSEEDLTQSVTWSSDASFIATIENAGSYIGRATAVRAGSTTIRAYFSGGGVSKSASIAMDVVSATLKTIVILPLDGSSIPVLITRQYSAFGVYNNDSIQDLTNLVQWGSERIEVAGINNNGLATARNAGSTTISARLVAPLRTVVGTTTLTVNEDPLLDVLVTAPFVTIGVGTTLQYTAKARYIGIQYDVTTQSIWSSSDLSKVIVDSTSGLATAVGATGTTSPISISAKFGGRTGFVSLTTIQLTLARVEITPVNRSIHQGLTQPFKAEAVFAEDGSKQDITNVVVWKSSARFCVSISNVSGSKGLATGLGNAGCISVIKAVYAFSGTITNATTTLTVTNPVPNDLALGHDHTCTRLTNGEMRCWGNNAFGQLGNGSVQNAPTPSPVFGAGGAAQLAAGGTHTCAVIKNGTMACWGNNANGQLGNETSIMENSPYTVPSVFGAIAVTTGGSHTCASFQSGAVKCWGLNTSGQLGNNSFTSSKIPVYVDSGSGVGVGIPPDKITSGGTHTCALLGASVYCWGDNTFGQLGDGMTASSTIPVRLPAFSSAPISISAGGSHTCVLLSGGSVQCWGKNDKGQLGDNSTTQRNTPVSVVDIVATAVAISAGDSHTCARLSDRTVRCWGGNSSGQLGNDTRLDSSAPVTVVDDLGTLSDVSSIVAGGSHTCAMLGNGQSKCWGENRSGQVGNGVRPIAVYPIEVPGIASATAVGTGQSYTCARILDGTIKCMGDNTLGQLGDGSLMSTDNPVTVIGITDASAIGIGGSHACATVSGGAKCWGNGALGRLGNGQINSTSTPVSVFGLSATAPIFAGSNHACVIVNGTASCWGNGGSGQLGSEPNVDQSAPVVIVSPTNFTSISGGFIHTCAITSPNGTVWCWGSNQDGQLGQGSSGGFSLVPVQVPSILAMDVSAGLEHTCAIRTEDHSVSCWGGYERGELGRQITDPNDTTHLSPFVGDVSVNGSSIRATAISAGPKHTCALLRPDGILPDGRVQCWGENSSGQLGNGGTGNEFEPTFVKVGIVGGDLSGVIALSAGGSSDASHTCAIMTGGSMRCWGDGFFGQIGSNFVIIERKPVGVAFYP